MEERREQGYRRVVTKVQLFNGRVLLEDLRELSRSILALHSVGKEEFQRGEFGGCEDGGRGTG